MSRIKRCCALLLALAVLMTSVPVAFAAESDTVQMQGVAKMTDEVQIQDNTQTAGGTQNPGGTQTPGGSGQTNLETEQPKKTGWVYENGYKLYYDQNGELVTDVRDILGKQSSYVIKVNKKMNVVTIYAKDGKKGYIIPVVSFLCSCGPRTPLGTFKSPAKYRWKGLVHHNFGQWCTRVKKGILFHSVSYKKKKKATNLDVKKFNQLGTTCSNGCIRLQAGNAKWIYNNCKLKTKIVIYKSKDPGPFGIPVVEKLPSWHTWDPTDPTVKNLCKEKGCH